MEVKIRRLNKNATLPTKGSVQAAGFDLYACIDGPLDIGPHETKMIGIGFAFAIPDGYFGALFARSGLAAKMGLRPANCVGVVDSDYRGEVIVALHNDTETSVTVEPNQRIAQLCVIPYLQVELEECDDLGQTVRGAGGFGHTGA